MNNKRPLRKNLLLWMIPGIIVLGIVGIWRYNVVNARALVLWPSNGWSTTTPEKAGVDSTELASMVDNLQSQNVHSFVLVRNGNIIAEGYNSDHDYTTAQDVYSVTKSITSALIGKAIDDKLIQNVDQPISNYLPELNQDADPRKKDILLSHILTMTSGFSWNNDNDVSSKAMTSSTDWIKYVLGLPLVADPGTSFTYNNGGVHLLSAILEKAIGKKEAQYAKEVLFNPLGIKNYIWQTDPGGHSIGSFGLSITARDMAKFGYLYLMNGNWEGSQLIPKQWVKKSTSQYLRFTDSAANQTEIGYGYLWWLRKGDYGVKEKTVVSDMYSADGSGGQRIFVMPEQNMVAVFTANNPDPFFADALIDKFIVPSVKSDKALPPNPDGNALLKHNTEAFKKQKDVTK
jgi:CubicO group peptidase (beta-lactamase class C family)